VQCVMCVAHPPASCACVLAAQEESLRRKYSALSREDLTAIHNVRVGRSGCRGGTRVARVAVTAPIPVSVPVCACL
jgi:hypothetical protein